MPSLDLPQVVSAMVRAGIRVVISDIIVMNFMVLCLCSCVEVARRHESAIGVNEPSYGKSRGLKRPEESGLCHCLVWIS